MLGADLRRRRKLCRQRPLARLLRFGTRRSCVFRQQAWLTPQALEAGVDLPFLTTHYLIERNREVLLWSLIVATHDLDRSGTFSWTERASLLEWLIVNAGGAVSGDAVRIGWPNRSDDRDETDDVLAWSGFGPPGATRYDFTSAHGDPFVELPIVDYQHGRGTSCWLHIVDCFGPSFLDENMVVEVNDVMRRIVAEKPHCGSCLIVAGLGASSPAGLDGFLPSHWSARDRATAAPIAPELAMGARTIAEADYGWAAVTPQLEHFDGLRDFCVRLIQRYSFALGSSLAVRLTLRGPTADVKETLEAMTTNPPAFLELIDKVTNQRSARGLDDLLLKLGDRSWPEPAPWEQ